MKRGRGRPAKITSTKKQMLCTEAKKIIKNKHADSENSIGDINKESG